MRQKWVFILAFALVSALALPAVADTQVQVLAIASEKSFQHAKSLTVALKRAVTRADGYSIPKGDFSLEVLSLALGCKLPPDDPCQKKVGKKVGAKRYIWGMLEVKGDEVVADLHLWENGAEKRTTVLRYNENLTEDDALLDLAAGSFAELMGVTQGVLVINAGTVSGEVFIDGIKVGLISGGRTELTVDPGPHEVIVRAKGFEDAKGSVNVLAGASAEVNLKPRSSSGANGQDPTADSQSSGSTNKILGYTGVGVGSVLALAGGYFWLRSYIQTNDDAFVDYRSGIPDGVDSCDAAKTGNGGPRNAEVADICDSNSTNKTLALILVPTGVVLAGVGTYFLLTDDSSEKNSAKRGIRVRPMVGAGPNGGAMSLHVTF